MIDTAYAALCERPKSFNGIQPFFPIDRITEVPGVTWYGKLLPRMEGVCLVRTPK